MKKVFVVLPLSLAIAALLSFGVSCLLHLLGFSMAVSLDSPTQSSWLVSFCIIFGILALAGLITVLILQIKSFMKSEYTRSIWIFTYIAALVFALPLLKVWETFFELMQMLL